MSTRVALVGQHGATLSSRRAQQARLARHVFMGVATAWTGVDMSTSLFPEVVTEIDANPEHKILNLYTRALLLVCHLPNWNKHSSTRSTRRSCCVVSRRDVMSQWNLGLTHKDQRRLTAIKSTWERSCGNLCPQLYCTLCSTVVGKNLFLAT